MVGAYPSVHFNRSPFCGGDPGTDVWDPASVIIKCEVTATEWPQNSEFNAGFC